MLLHEQPSKTTGRPASTRSGRIASARRWVGRRPVLAIFLLALAARVTFAIISALVVDGYLIPDENQYVAVARLASDGELDHSVWNGYGPSLYKATGAFTVPLTILFWLLAPWRILGQLFAAVLGAGTAALTTRMGLEILPRRWALTAGILVALLPSQVLWSSVVLRESAVWFCLAGIATITILARKAEGARRIGMLLAVAAVLLLALGFLRGQTFVAAAWMFPLAMVLHRETRRRALVGGALVLALFVPVVAETGIGGISLVERVVPALGTVRAHLSMNADSSFRPATTIPAQSAAGPDLTPDRPRDPNRPRGSGGGDPGELPVETTTTVPLPAVLEPSSGSTRHVIESTTGTTYVVQETVGANLRAIPAGLVATLFRPWPWDRPTGASLVLALLENLLWYVLYAVAALGVWHAARSRSLPAFPLLAIVSIVLVAAVTQGNVGTAFRHRGQLLWALALLVAFGGHAIERARGRRAAALD